jgi:hypothetical protein
VHDPGDVIDALLVDRNARVLRLAELLRQHFDRLARVEGEDVDARGHDLVREAVAEVDDLLQQLPLGGLDHARFLADVDVRLHFLVAHLFLFVVGLLRALETLEQLAQRKEERPEDVVADP